MVAGRAEGFGASAEIEITAPAFLEPLGDGASETAVHSARDAIEARADPSAAVRADHLAVLGFVAEADQLLVAVMRAYIPEEQLMESTLYQ